LKRLAEITAELPAHDEAVRTRLAARLGQPDGPGFGSEEQSARHREFLAISDATNELTDLTGNSVPDGAETITRWRQSTAGRGNTDSFPTCSRLVSSRSAARRASLSRDASAAASSSPRSSAVSGTSVERSPLTAAFAAASGLRRS
jgi:hypothetical protein